MLNYIYLSLDESNKNELKNNFIMRLTVKCFGKNLNNYIIKKYSKSNTVIKIIFK